MFYELIMIIFGCFTFSIISPNHTDPQHCIVSFAWLETDSTCCLHAYRQWWNNSIDFIIIYFKDSSTTAIMSVLMAECVLPQIERYSSRCKLLIYFNWVQIQKSKLKSDIFIQTQILCSINVLNIHHPPMQISNKYNIVVMVVHNNNSHMILL